LITNVIDRTDSANIYENYRPPIGETSYTEGKKYIYLCVRNVKEETHSDDILLFVFIHELAHIASNETGHTTMFWAVFRFLLTVFCKYTYNGVSLHPSLKYCNIDLYTNPYQSYCNNLKIDYNALFDESAFISYT